MSDAQQPTPSNVRVEIAVDGTTSFETSGTLNEAAAATNGTMSRAAPGDDEPDPLVLMWAAEQRAKRAGVPEGGPALQRMQSDLI